MADCLSPGLDELEGQVRSIGGGTHVPNHLHRHTADIPQAIGYGNYLMITGRVSEADPPQLGIKGIVLVEHKALEVTLGGISGIDFRSIGVDIGGPGIGISLLPANRPVHFELDHHPTPVKSMRSILKQGIVIGPEYHIEKEIAVGHIVHITDGEFLGQCAGLGRLARTLDGSHRGKVHRSQLGQGLYAEQAAALTAAAGSELGAGQGEGYVPGIDPLEDFVLLACIGDFHIIFPLEVVLTVLVDEYGDAVSDGALNVKALFLVHIKIPVPVGADVGIAL
ncbi:hypothetical protein ES703_48448 [subsurface metagenome]